MKGVIPLGFIASGTVATTSKKGEQRTLLHYRPYWPSGHGMKSTSLSRWWTFPLWQFCLHLCLNISYGGVWVSVQSICGLIIENSQWDQSWIQNLTGVPKFSTFWFLEIHMILLVASYWYMLQVGCGGHIFERSKSLLREWKHFQLGWTYVRPSTPTQKGTGLCVVAKPWVIWTLNPLKILYAENSKDRGEKKAFSLGATTLKGHLLAGEEKFKVVWKQDDTVWYTKAHAILKQFHSNKTKLNQTAYESW